MNLRRASFLTTITLCALALFLSSTSASAVGQVIGILRVKPNTNATINGQPASEGAELHDGDVLITGADSAVINFTDGTDVLIDAHTHSRIYAPTDDLSNFVVLTSGGYHILHGPPNGQPPGTPDPLPGDDSPGPIPGGLSGNIAGTSNGGGGAGSPGPTTTRVIPGQGVGLFDSFGTFIRFL